MTQPKVVIDKIQVSMERGMVIFVICTMFLLLFVCRFDYKVVLVLAQAISLRWPCLMLIV